MSVVCCPLCVNFFFKQHLLNHWPNFKITHKCLPNGSTPRTRWPPDWWIMSWERDNYVVHLMSRLIYISRCWSDSFYLTILLYQVYFEGNISITAHYIIKIIPLVNTSHCETVKSERFSTHRVGNFKVMAPLAIVI